VPGSACRAASSSGLIDVAGLFAWFVARSRSASSRIMTPTPAPSAARCDMHTTTWVHTPRCRTAAMRIGHSDS
jgi:hypothetical protein